MPAEDAWVPLALLGVRLAQALATSHTFFQPDEFWQAQEMAHRLAFGYGYRTWEWASARPIRSIIHPAMLAPLYVLLDKLGAQHLLLYAPSTQQALLSAFGDWCSFRLARRVGGESVARLFVILHVCSFYGLYTATRTLSNNVEAVLCSAALLYWPLSSPQVAQLSSSEHVRASFRRGLAAAFLAVLFRPTILVFWAFLGGKLLYDAGNLPHNLRGRSLWTAVSNAAAVGLCVLAAGAALDSWYYGQPTFIPITFLWQNVVHGISVFYGANPWHWYVTQGLPFICTVALPWVVLGWYRVVRSPEQLILRDPSAAWTLGTASLWVVFVFSLLSHKEFRFLQPLVPLLHLFGAVALADRWQALPQSVRSGTWSSFFRTLPPLLQCLLLLQVPAVLYAALFHSRGQVAVMPYLHAQAASGNVRSIGFLMPCHSTPWQSHLHSRRLEVPGPDGSPFSGDWGNAWFIACPPPKPNDTSLYWDQSDFFYHDPIHYIERRFPATVDQSFPPTPPPAPRTAGTQLEEELARHAQYDLGWRHAWPSHLIVFDALLHERPRECRDNLECQSRTLAHLLRDKGYRESQRFWNSVINMDARRRGDIVVLKHEG